MENDVIDMSVAWEKLMSGECGTGKVIWKVGLVGNVSEELRREPLGLLDGKINDIAVEDRGESGW